MFKFVKPRFWLLISIMIVLVFSSLTYAADVVTLYTNANFSGTAVSLPEGEYKLSDLQARGIADNTLSSVKVTSGYQVILYRDNNFQGSSRCYTDGYNGNCSDLATDTFDNMTSSVRIWKPVVETTATLNSRAENDALNGWWAAAQQTKASRIAWWKEARFGCFMHWGAYSYLGGIYGSYSDDTGTEQLFRKAKIPFADYVNNVVKKFNPSAFNADQWVQTLKNAGMKYLIITAKHHDGFATYNSDAYYYNMTLTPFVPRDPMMELRQACDKYGLKFGFYYSHVVDWEHPDAYSNDWEYYWDYIKPPTGNWFDVHPELLARKRNYYIDQKCIPQLLELVNKYHADLIWGDVDGKLPVCEKLRMMKQIWQANPNVIINGRFCRGGSKSNWGDYQNTGDNPLDYPSDPGGDWEGIPTTNGSYGYASLNHNYHPVSFFIQLIAKAASFNGNTLLNVGPRGDGMIDDPDVAILQGIGKWFAVNGESIYGTDRSPIALQSWGRVCRKGGTHYLHVFTWPTDGKITVTGYYNQVGTVTKAYLLADPNRTALSTTKSGSDLIVTVPATAPDSADSVVVVESSISGSPTPTSTPTITPATPTPTVTPTLTVTPTPASPSPGINLALNKPVTCSSQQTGNEAQKIVDDDTATRWSASPYSQWVRIDLGTTYSINRTELVPYSNRAYQYRIEVSADGTTFTQVIDKTGNTASGSMLTDTFTAINGRYVRLTVTGCANYTGTWASINEFRVFGSSSPATPTVTVVPTATLTPTVTPTPTVTTTPTASTVTNLALNKPVTFSSEQTGNEATHINDGDAVTSRWSASPYPQWVRIDLGATYDISKTEVVPLSNRAYQYRVEVSTDGTNFTQVVDKTTNTTGGALLTDTFATVIARYVRLTVTGCYNYTGTWASIVEFRVFGN